MNLPSLVNAEIFFPPYFANRPRVPDPCEPSASRPESCNEQLINALLGNISERGKNLTYVSEKQPTDESTRTNFLDAIASVKRKITLENKFINAVNNQRLKAARYFKSLSNENIAKSTLDEFANLTLIKSRLKSNSSGKPDGTGN